MKRSYKLPTAIAFALALGSTQALALGLGQIQVKSALNQPLVAEIPVIVDSPAEAAGLQVGLASDEDFSRIGLSRGSLNVPIDFAVGADAQGRPVIRVTSKDAVRDPYLDFLIQVNWAKGRLLREYTVLLDPVTAPSRGVAAAPTRSAAPASHPAPAAPAPAPQRAAPSAAPTGAAAAAPAAAAPAAAPARTAASGEYEVKAGDTLWDIANANRPDASVNVNQMMLALLKANPDAFYQDNVNTLKRGAILRIPGREQIAGVGSAQAAAAEIRRQFEDWRGSTAQKSAVVAESGGAEAAPEATATAAKPAAGDRLKLVPPERGGTSASTRAGVAGGTGDAAIANLKQNLARAQEGLAAQQQEADELKARLKESEDLNTKNQRLLSLKDAEIAELQRKLAEVQKQAGVPVTAAAKTPAPVAAPVPPPKPAAAGAATPARASTAAAPAAAASVAKTTPATAGSAVAPKPVEAKPAPKPAVTTKPLPPAKPVRAEPIGEETPWYRQDWVLPAGGAAAVALILLGLLRLVRRPKRAPEAAAAGISSQFGDSPLAGAHGGDTAYGEEEGTLIAQLAEHPDDIGLHLELASLYYAHRDVERFEAAAETMHSYVTDPAQPEWQEVRAMGEELAPQHPLFASAAAAASAAPAIEPDDESAALESFDLGQYADTEPEAGAPAAVVAARSEYSFDFDLTPPSPPAVPGAAAAQPPVAGRSEDLDLPPLDFEETPAHEPPAASGEMEAMPAFDLGDLGQVPAPGKATTPPAEGYGDDPVDTKLDLARAYLDMGDPDGAKAMLEEVMAEGSAKQKSEAQKLLGEIG
ncbi:MAG TPA: FimV/HubP family polar landmark protein [Mizugakiibacter sp.]